MKIIIPYHQDQWFPPADQEFLQALGLTDAMVMDQALNHWLTYVHGSATDAYELTMDETYEHVFVHFGDTDACVHAQQLMAAKGDELTEIIRCTAIRLHQLLAEIPDEISRRCAEIEEYTYLKVKEIYVPGNYAVIETVANSA